MLCSNMIARGINKHKYTFSHSGEPLGNNVSINTHDQNMHRKWSLCVRPEDLKFCGVEIYQLASAFIVLQEHVKNLKCFSQMLKTQLKEITSP